MVNNILEAPKYLEIHQYASLKNTLFLAGSITGAWNWQEKVANKLSFSYNVFNPRRQSYPEGVEKEQIQWEYCHLGIAENVLFWFSHETVAPITLLELGTLFEEGRQYTKNIFIGIDPNYQRKTDVLIQTELRAPNLLKNIVYDLDSLVKLAIDNASKNL